MKVDVFDDNNHQLTSGGTPYAGEMDRMVRWFAWDQTVVIPKGELDDDLVIHFLDKPFGFLDVGRSHALMKVHDIPQDTKGLQYGITLAVGAYEWSISSSTDGDTGKPYCGVGGWDSWDIWIRYPSRQMDCFWNCAQPAPRPDDKV